MTTTESRNQRTINGDNPFQVDPADDLLHRAPDVPGWSETMFFHVWSPDESVGIFIHCGRWPAEPDLWWAQTIAMLPAGRLVVDRSWGRSTDRRGPATGNLTVICTEPLRRWRLSFDGAGETTDLSSMTAGSVGGGPAQRLRFDIELEALAPVWDMHGALGISNLSWASFHHTQGFVARGSLTVDDRHHAISGVGSRDHSSGPRDVGQLGGLHFFVANFPDLGRVANGLVNWRRDGTVDHRVCTVQQDGVAWIADDFSCTGLDDYRTHRPHELTLTLGADPAARILTAQRLHGYSLTLQAPNENLNGVDLRGEPDALVVTQSTVRFTDADGQVGYGVVERDYRPSMLPSTEER